MLPIGTGSQSPQHTNTSPFGIVSKFENGIAQYRPFSHSLTSSGVSAFDQANRERATSATYRSKRFTAMAAAIIATDCSLSPRVLNSRAKATKAITFRGLQFK